MVGMGEGLHSKMFLGRGTPPSGKTFVVQLCLAASLGEDSGHVGIQAAFGGFGDGHSAILGADDQMEV